MSSATSAAAGMAGTAGRGGAPIQVVSMGSYHIGGRKVTIEGGAKRRMPLWPGGPLVDYDPNGDFQAGQMYVQYTRLAHPVIPYPVCMIHGGGASGALWETTQAGTPGWQFMFLQNGFDVNVSDGVERGRSSWAQFPEINQGEPMFMSYAERWTTYRLGPKPGVPFAGSRFDASKFDQFMKQQVPRWTTSNAMVQAAYDEYFGSMTDGFVICAHSQGGLFALAAALRHPENVRGVVLVESSSTLDPAQTDVSALEGVPFLFVYGDFLSDEYRPDGYTWPGQAAYEGSMRHLHAHLRARGCDSTWLELPRIGIRGNTHAMMLEDNSRQIADLVCGWMREHVR
ncbi:alpha/beta fold hydrolase [bacterium]|nr:alpha/beta fold hydrolase [bacterium]